MLNELFPHTDNASCQIIGKNIAYLIDLGSHYFVLDQDGKPTRFTAYREALAHANVLARVSNAEA